MRKYYPLIILLILSIPILILFFNTDLLVIASEGHLSKKLDILYHTYISQLPEEEIMDRGKADLARINNNEEPEYSYPTITFQSGKGSEYEGLGYKIRIVKNAIKTKKKLGYEYGPTLKFDAQVDPTSANAAGNVQFYSIDQFEKMDHR